MSSDVQLPGDSGPNTVETEIVRVMRILRPAEVCRRTTLSHLYRLQKTGQFPRFINIDGRACGTIEHKADACVRHALPRPGRLPRPP